jgi:hypothetical protein
MHAFNGSLLFTLCGALLLTTGAAMAAEPSPPVRLRIPFVKGFMQDGAALTQSSVKEDCRISGEQALRIERSSSDPCLAADAAPGGACFDRLGLGALRSQRALLPREDGQRCVD